MIGVGRAENNKAKNLVKNKNYLRDVGRQGCCHSSVDYSAPSMLTPQVRVPSTPSMLLSIYIDLCHVEKTKINKQRPGVANIFFSKMLVDIIVS